MAEDGPSESQREEWTAAFNEMADENGVITKEDIEVHFQKSNKNPTSEDMEAVMGAVQLADTDGDGKINLEEFIQLQMEASKMPFYDADIQNDLIEALKVYDVNEDGTISKDELRGILDGYDDQTLDDVISAADTNGDGNLSIAEIATYLSSTM